MSSLNAFLVAVDLAQRQRDEARLRLRDSQNALQAAMAQLTQLQNYAQENVSRWGAQPGAQLRPEVMYHHYQFQGRLDYAMGLQSQVVNEQETKEQVARQALLACDVRLSTLNKVVEQRRREQENKLARSEQKQTDERAAQQYARQRAHFLDEDTL